MAGTTPLQTTINKWRQREAFAQSQGIPRSAYAGLMQQDLANVQSGKSPMSDEQVNVGILSAARQQPLIKDNSTNRGLPGIIENIPSDVKGIVTGFVPGIAHLIAHLPSEVQNVPQDISKGWSGIENDPLLSMVPGVYDVAALASGHGSDLEAHPVGALLDVLPLAGSAGKLAMAGRLADGMIEAGSPVESLAKGNPLKALGRLSSDKLSNVLQRAGMDVNIRHSLATAANRLTISQPIRDLTRVYNVNQKLGALRAKEWAGKVFDGLQGLDRQDRADLVTLAIHRGDPEFSHYLNAVTTDPSKQQLLLTALDHIDNINDDLLTRAQSDPRNPVATVITPGGHEEIYSGDSPVVASYKRVQSAENNLAASTRRREQWQQKVAKYKTEATDRTTKYRHFNESDQAFNNRPAHPPSPQHLNESLRSLSTIFGQNGRILSDVKRGIINGDIKAAQARIVTRDTATVRNSLTNLSNHLAAAHLGTKGALKAARMELTRLTHVLNHRSWDNLPDIAEMRRFVKEVRKETTGLEHRTRTARGAAKRISIAEKNAAYYAQQEATRRAQVDALRQKYHDTLSQRPPARFQPLIEELQRKNLQSAISQTYAGADLNEVMKEAATSTSMAKVKEALGSKLYNDILSSSARMWMDLANRGHNPVWLHEVDPNRYEDILNIRPLATHTLKPSQLKNAVLNFSPRLTDIAAGVTDAGAQFIEQDLTDAFIQEMFSKGSFQTAAELEKMYGDLYDHSHPVTDPVENRATWITKQIEKNHTRSNPYTDWGLSNRVSITDPEELYLDKGTATALRFMQGDYRSPLKMLSGRTWNKTLSLYKFSVLTGPRHLVHVGIAGWMFASIREPRSLLQIGNAIDRVKKGEVDLRLQQHLYDGKADQLFQYQAGRTLARHWQQASGFINDKAHALQRFEEKLATIQRVAVQLSVEKRGLGAEAGIRTALKTFIDMDGLAPVERVILKQVFPFYAFTRHLFRYLFTLPVDHPYRAAILARFAEQEQEEWNTGLPQIYQQMMYLGHADANGNVWAVDYKNINPFRSIGGDFTLGGFFSSLNPVITTGLQLAGVNVLSGTPDLYPGVDFDPSSGTIVAARPNVGLTIAQSFVPETQGLAAIFGWTQRMKVLKSSNPSAYARQLFSDFNLPFATSKINPDYLRAKEQINLLRFGQQALPTAEEYGNWKNVNQLNLVPYQGGLVTPQSIQELYAMIQGQEPQGMNIDPRSLIRNLRRPAPGGIRLRVNGQIVG